MANLTLFRGMLLNECKRFRSIFVTSTHRCSSTMTEKASEPDLKEENLAADQEEEEKYFVEQLRNVSGLSHKHHQQYHGTIKEPPFKDLKTRRQMYTMYGSKSGEDPRLLWPSRQDIIRAQEEEKEEEISLFEKMRIMQEEKDAQLREKNERCKMIQKNMNQMDKWISEYYKKIETAELEVQKRKDKKDALLNEAREYFGYRIKANHPKFQQMVEEKEEKERQEAKELKKKEKARKLAERLEKDVLAMKMSSEQEKQIEEKSSV